jgi:hypothetical protein
VEGFEVVQVPELFWLTDTFSASEPLVSIEAKTVIKIVIEATKQQNAANGSACPALA